MILADTVVITLFSLLNIGIAFIVQVIMASKFGAGPAMDAYLAATTIPFLLRSILINAIGFAFIPLFVQYRTKDGEGEAWKMSSDLFNILTLTLVVLTVLGIVFSSRITSLIVPGFSKEKFLLTVSLTKTLWPIVVFSGLAALLTGIFQSYRKFKLPAIAPVLNTLIMLVLILVTSPHIGIKSVVIGTLVGFLIQLVVLLPILSKSNYHFSLRFHPGALRSIILMLPLLFGGLFSRAVPVIDRYLASRLPEGSISYLGYASQISILLSMVVAKGISTTIFPVMSEDVARGNIDKLKKTMSLVLRMMFLVIIPISFILSVLSTPLIKILFERGNFHSNDTSSVAGVLPWYLLAAIGMSAGNITGRGYYVLQDTKTPTLIGICEILGYFFLCVLFINYFSYVGIGIASVFYYNVALVINGLVVRAKLGGRGGKTIISSSIKISLASLFAAVVICYIMLPVLNPFGAGITVLGGGVTGLIVFFLIGHYIFKLEEIRIFFSFFERKFKRDI